MVAADHLKKSFGPTVAVDDVSFTINPGEIVGFLGPNGAGKTTTMRLLTGYYTPDVGTISINNIDMVSNPIEAQKNIGYLPENNPLYKDMLVSELLTLSANLYEIPRSKRKEAFDFVVDAVGIEEYFYRPAGELSKGYKQRVGIAMAMLHRPDILIMDEPSEGLDPNQRTDIRQLIKELAKEHTIIMSTHVMQEVTAVCNRIIIINNGMIVADGSSEALTGNAGSKSHITLEISGNDVQPTLEKLSSVESIESVQEKNGRVKLEVIASKEDPLQPHISNLVKEKGWVIWQMQEQHRNLEDIFHELTISEHKE